MASSSLAALEVRVTALELEAREMRELVDGQEKWSHRKRLHELENDDRAAKLMAQALKEFRELRSSRWTKVREWGGFAIAVAAVIFAALH